MLHLLAPGVPLPLSCIVSQQTLIRVDYIAQKRQESPQDCFFLEEHSSVVLLHYEMHLSFVLHVFQT